METNAETNILTVASPANCIASLNMQQDHFSDSGFDHLPPSLYCQLAQAMYFLIFQPQHLGVGSCLPAKHIF